MKKKIILFGASGATGIYLTDYIFERINHDEYELVAVGHRKTNYFEKFPIKYYSVDISDYESLNLLPNENIHSIIILSGILPARMDKDNPSRYIDINTKGILNIVEYYKSSGVERVSFAVSIADLYGYLPDHPELFDDMPLKYNYNSDHTVYAISKTAAAEIIKTYAIQFNFKYFIFRLPNIYLYSPEKYYFYDFKEKLVAYRYLIERAMKGLDIELWGDPNVSRDIVYVKDFCQFFYNALFEDAPSGYYNIGSDKTVSMKEQIEGIIEVFSPKDNKSKIIFKPEKGSFISRHMNIDKAKKYLKYKAQYSYIEYLEDYKKEMLADRFKGL